MNRESCYRPYKSARDRRPIVRHFLLIAAYSLGTLVGLSSVPGRAENQHFTLKMFFGRIYPIEFDGAQCITPADGKIYFALGDEVYRWQFDSATLFKQREDFAAGIGRPRPPDALQPMDCRDYRYSFKESVSASTPSALLSCGTSHTEGRMFLRRRLFSSYSTLHRKHFLFRTYTRRFFRWIVHTR